MAEPSHSGPALSRRAVVSAAAVAYAVPPRPAAAQTARALPFPGLTPSVAFATPERSSGALPMRLDGMSHLRVTAYVNGARVSAILDTGAARAIIDRGFAARMGIPLRPGFRAAGITDNAQGELAEDVSVTLGSMALNHLTPGVLDLARISADLGDPAAIVIGRDLFHRVVADFDFAGGMVSFHDADASNLAGKHTISLGQTPRGTPHVPVSIEGAPEIEAGLDIGYNGSLLVSPDYARQLGLDRGRPLTTVASVGVEGVSVNQMATVKHLTLAGATLAGAPAEIPARWNRSVPAIIGLDVIKKFRMLTDYTHNRIGLFAAPEALTAPLPKDRSGIGAIPTREGLNVIHVAPGSPAERCGLHAGDRIVAIDDQRADLDYVRAHPRLGSRPAGSVFHLQLSDGRSATLKLADYF